MIFSLIKRCFLSINNKFFFSIMGITLLLTLVLFSGFIFTTNLLITHYTEDLFWPLSSAVEWLGSGTAMILSYFLFPLTFPIISSLFAEKIFVHMEEKHYDLSVNPKINSLPSRLLASTKFVCVALTINLFAFAFYLIPVIGIFIYFALNAYLFGKEYFDMTAHRYSDIKQAKSEYKTNRFSTITVGLLICVMFTFPIINLFAPVLAIIIMIHFYHAKISKADYH